MNFKSIPFIFFGCHLYYFPSIWWTSPQSTKPWHRPKKQTTLISWIELGLFNIHTAKFLIFRFLCYWYNKNPVTIKNSHTSILTGNISSSLGKQSLSRLILTKMDYTCCYFSHESKTVEPSTVAKWLPCFACTAIPYGYKF